MITEKQKKALNILWEEGRMRPKRFAELMWPDSPYWNKCYNCGPYGASFGIKMFTAAGGYLGRLKKKGWVRYTFDYNYCITQQGINELKRKNQKDSDY